MRLRTAGFSCCALAFLASCAGETARPAARSAAACVANLAHGNELDPLPELVADTRTVCAALEAPGSVWPEASGQLESVEDLKQVALRLPAAGPRLLFYTGHGRLSDDGRQLEFLFGNSANAPRYEAIDGLLEALGSGARNGASQASDVFAGPSWSALLLNTCDSGYADVHAIAAPITVVGSGYGFVSRAPKGAQGEEQSVGATVSPFAAALARALSGAADTWDGRDDCADSPSGKLRMTRAHGGPWRGNCDGMVTDIEAARYVDCLLGTPGERPAHWPSAVVRRQANADVPLTLHENRAACAGSFQDGAGSIAWLCNPKSEHPALCRALHEQQALVQRSRPRLVDHDRIYLLLSDQTGAQGTLEGLNCLGALGIERVAVSADAYERARALAEFARFTKFYFLELQTPYPEGGVWAELTDLESGSTLKGIRYAPAAPLDLAEIVRAIPRRLEIFDFGCGTPARAGPCELDELSKDALWLRVDGRFPCAARDSTCVPRSVNLYRWSNWVSSCSAPVVESITPEKLRPIACPTRSGQCFTLPRGPATAAIDASDALVIAD